MSALTGSHLPVLLVTPRYPPALGGIERVVAALARGLAQRGFRVEVVTTDPTGRLPALQDRDGVLVRRFPTVAGDSVYFVSPHLGRWLMENAARFALIHAHSYHTPLALQAALAAGRAAVPLLLSPYYHGTGHSPLRRALHVPYRLAGAWLVQQASRLVYISEAERDTLERRFGPAANVVAPCGVDIARVHNAPQLPAAGGRKTVLAVGRLERYKQTDRLVQALAHLPPDYELVVIGAGPLRPRLELLAAQLGLQDRLKLLDHVDQQGLCAWYHCAHAFASLSQHESFGLTVLEAAAAGAPLVVSDIPAHREVVRYLPEGRAAFVPLACEPGDVGQAIQDAVRLGRAAETASWQLPTWEGMVDTVAAAYDEVIACVFS